VSGPAAALTGHACEARGVGRRFGRFRALRNVDLVIPAGQTVALFGPNGAGKTTFLRVVAQLLRAHAGTVQIYGRDPSRDPTTVRSALGFVSHQSMLYLDLTALENLEFAARLHGLSSAQAELVLAMVRIERRDVTVRNLSRGQQQRVALARALVHEPRLLLLDEPWTGLDRGAQRILEERLVAHRAGGGSALVVTHDLSRGWEVADRIALLAGGRIVLDEPRERLAFAELEGAFTRAAAEGEA